MSNLTTPASVQKLQTALHDKAKEAPDFRFHALYDKVYRKDVLAFAYDCCKANGGTAGVDGQTFEDIETYGRERWLDELAQELKSRTYQPLPVRRVYIPKPDGKQRPLGVPAIRDRAAEVAAVLVLEPIFEADLPPEQYAYRRDRSALDAVRRVHKLVNTGHGEIVDADLSSYFDTLPHSELLKSVARRVVDGAMLHLIKMWLEAPVEETDESGNKRRSTRNRDEGRGTPQGSPMTPRTQKINLNLSGRSSLRGGSGIANDTPSSLDVCLLRLYLYVVCLAPLLLNGRSASIDPEPCFSFVHHSPKPFNSSSDRAPFLHVRLTDISSRPNA